MKSAKGCTWETDHGSASTAPHAPKAQVREHKADGHDEAEKASTAVAAAAAEKRETARLRAQIVESPEVRLPFRTP